MNTMLHEVELLRNIYNFIMSHIKIQVSGYGIGVRKTWLGHLY